MVNIWSIWLGAIHSLVLFLSSGMGLGMAVVLATLLLRATLLPISWSGAYRGLIRQKKMLRLKPELERLKAECAGKPDQYLQKMQALYREHGLSAFDGKSMLGSVVQMPLVIGMYETLRGLGNGVRFLWVPNLLRPDFIFAVIVGVTTGLMMMANPNLPEHMRLLMIVLPAIIAGIMALKFCSVLAIYWATTNSFSAIQTLVLHRVVARRIQSGAITI